MKLGLPSRPAPQGEDWADRLRRRLAWLESPLSTYYLLIGSAGMLTVMGLIMVFSASSVTSYMATGSSLTQVRNQAIFAVFGIVAAVVASRLPQRVLRRVALPVFLVSLALQSLVLVPQFALKQGGNTNWIHVGSFSMQPSETGKIAIILMTALILSNRRAALYDWRRAAVPPLLFTALLVVFVMIGGDLGTTMVLGSMVVGMLWTGGLPRKLFGFLLAAIALGLPLAVLTSSNRTARISAWWTGCAGGRLDACYQQIHGTYALADGGLWGLGPGASREKWAWLPEAQNDFIFSIIGEELGLPGTLAVIFLYVVFAYACYRLIAQSKDMYVRVATAGVMTWICVQAIINIGSVLGLLPIIGVPLPFVSQGGSALVVALAGVGLLISFARSEPAAHAALQERPRRAARAVAVVPRRKVRP